MNEKKTLAFIFVFLLTLTLISIFFLIINVHLIFYGLYYQIILSLALINLLIAILFLKKFLAEVFYDIEDKKDKEKNARDCILYNQLFSPPEINN